jgi:Domain of unknown function (DUF1844)
MSTIWTPSGERPVGREEPSPQPGAASSPGAAAGAEDEPTEEEMAARMAEFQRELLEAPAALVITNHCIGLFQLAAIHLEAQPPNLEEAQLAIDALAAIVERLGSRLGAEERPLQEALTNLRLAFVEVRGRAAGQSAEPG